LDIDALSNVFRAIQQLMEEEEEKPKRQIGFKDGKDD